MADNLKVAGLRLVIDGAAKFNSTIGQINSELKISSAEFAKLQAQFGNNSKAVELLAGKQKLLQDKLRASKDIGAQYNRILEDTVEKYGEYSPEADKVRVKIAENEAEQAKLEKQLEATTRQLKIQSSEWTQFGQKCQDAGKKMQDIGDKIAKVGKSLSTKVTAPIVAFGTAAGKAAIDFETAFAGVAKTVDATDEELAQISDEIRQMAKDIPATTTEIAGVAEAAGQLGIATEDVMSFTRVMIDLGNSTNMSADEAAVALAKFVNITGMASEDYSRLGSSIVALGNNFSTTENDIVAMSTRLAAAGTLSGLTETEILALSAAMSSVGIEAQAGGTAMAQTMNTIETAVATGSDKVQEFARIAGMSTDEFAKAWEDRPIEALTAFITGLGKLDEQGESATMVLDELGLSGVRQSNMLKSLALASDILTDAVKMSSDAWEENTALSNEASKRYETMASKIQVMKNTVKDVGITIGNILLPYVEKLVNGIKNLTERFANLDEKQQANILKFAAIAAAAGPVLTILGKLTSGIGSAISLVGKAASAIGALSGAASGFGAVMTALGGPVGIAVAALGALAIAVIACDDAYGSLDRTLNEAEKSWGKVSKAKEDALSKGEQEITDIQTLKLELDSIVDANGRVKEGYEERAAYIAGELSKATGLEVSLVDGVIQSYGDLGAAIDDYVEKRRAEIALEAGAEAYKAALQGRKDLEQAYVDSYNNMLRAQENYNNASEGRDKATAGVLLQQAIDLYQGLEEQYNSYGEEIKSYEADLAAFRNGEYEKVSAGLSGLLVSMEQFTAMSREEQEQQLRDTQAALDEKTRLYQLTGDEQTKVQADALALQAQQEASYLSTRNSDRRSSDSELEGQQSSSNSRMESENRRANSEMTSQDKAGNAEREGEQLRSFAKIEADQKTYNAKYVGAIRDTRPAALSATQEVTGAVSGELSSVEGKSYNWGSNAVGSFIQGLRARIGGVASAASEIAQTVADYIGHNSPAKKGPGRFITKWGGNAIKAWIEGMMSMQPELAKIAAELAETAVGGLNKEASKLLTKTSEQVSATAHSISDEFNAVLSSTSEALSYAAEKDYSAMMLEAKSLEEFLELAAQRNAKIMGENIDLVEQGYRDNAQLLSDWADATGQTVEELEKQLAASMTDLKDAVEEEVDQMVAAFGDMAGAFADLLNTIGISGDVAVDYDPEVDYSALMDEAKDTEEFLELAAKRNAKIMGENINLVEKGWRDNSSIMNTWLSKTTQDIGTIRSVLTDALEDVSKYTSDSANKIVDTASRKMVELKDNTDQMKKDMTASLSSMPNDFYTAGMDTINGLIKGLQNRTSALYETIRSIAAQTVAAMKAELEISSPSRVFARLGGYVDEGFAQGMKTMADKPKYAAVEMARGVVDGVLAMQSSLRAVGLRPVATNGLGATADNRSYSFGGVTVQNLTVRSDADIKAIARELYRLQVSNARGKGVVA